MWYAAATCNADLLAELLVAGAKFNRGDASSNTPLGVACEKGAVRCVELLLLVRADPNGKFGGET